MFGSMLWRVAGRGFDDGGFLVETQYQDVADQVDPVSNDVTVCLAFDMLTVMQHSDTNPVALAGFNELANCSWGNDERELPGFLLVFTRRNTDLVLNELLGSTV